jgi:hypothetical protein
MHDCVQCSRVKTLISAGFLAQKMLKTPVNKRLYHLAAYIDPAIKYDESTYQKYPVPAKAGIQFR